MKTQVNYLMSGPAHLPYLVVSLQSLRKWYDGPVVVYTWPDSYEFAVRIAEDKDLDIILRRRDPSYRGKNAQFLDKILMMQGGIGDPDAALYLDADTMVVGPLDHLFETANEYGFAATQFNKWDTSGGIIRRRITRLLDYQAKGEIESKVIGETLSRVVPSVNGGVFAARPQSIVLPVWYQWTKIAKKIFIADETVLHLMQVKFGSIDQYKIVMGGAYNTSPKHMDKNLDDDEVIIWHFHGDSNVRPDKTQKGFDIWWPNFAHCLKNNVGQMQEWIDSIGNKWIKKIRKR